MMNRMKRRILAAASLFLLCFPLPGEAYDLLHGLTWGESPRQVSERLPLVMDQRKKDRGEVYQIFFDDSLRTRAEGFMENGTVLDFRPNGLSTIFSIFIGLSDVGNETKDAQCRDFTAHFKKLYGEAETKESTDDEGGYFYQTHWTFPDMNLSLTVGWHENKPATALVIYERT